MTNTNHTPGPWTIAGVSLNPHEGHVIESDSADGRTIAWTCNSLDNNGEEYISQEDIANAEFIVRACNSYYALLEALENLLGQLENVSDYCQTCSEYWSTGDGGDLLHQPGCATDAAYEARNKAKGGSR